MNDLYSAITQYCEVQKQKVISWLPYANLVCFQISIIYKTSSQENSVSELKLWFCTKQSLAHYQFAFALSWAIAFASSPVSCIFLSTTSGEGPFQSPTRWAFKHKKLCRYLRNLLPTFSTLVIYLEVGKLNSNGPKDSVCIEKRKKLRIVSSLHYLEVN